EDDLALCRGVHERAHLLAGVLEPGGRPLGELVDAAVHAPVRGLVELRHRVEHLARLLRGRRGVQVGERLAVEVLLEDRAGGAQTHRVQSRLRLYRHPRTVARCYFVTTYRPILPYIMWLSTCSAPAPFCRGSTGRRTCRP